MNSGVGACGSPCHMCGWIGLVPQSLISQCAMLLISLQSYGGQGEVSGKVNEKHRCWWRGEPMAGLLLFSNYFLQSFPKTKWHRGGGARVIEVTCYWSIHMIGNTGCPHPFKLYSFFLTNYYCFFH